MIFVPKCQLLCSNLFNSVISLKDYASNLFSSLMWRLFKQQQCFLILCSLLGIYFIDILNFAEFCSFRLTVLESVASQGSDFPANEKNKQKRNIHLYEYFFFSQIDIFQSVFQLNWKLFWYLPFRFLLKPLWIPSYTDTFMENSRSGLFKRINKFIFLFIWFWLSFCFSIIFYI